MAPGSHCELVLSARLGEVRGLVLRGGRPEPDVVVIAVRHTEWAALLDLEGAEITRPHTRTDASGGFRFACARRGIWHLYARHRDATYPTGPLPVRFDAVDRRHDVVLVLDDARVHGRCDVDGIAEADRRFTRAQLFRLDQASRDPFVSSAGRLREDPLDDGAFAFELLPAGHWVLRLIGRPDTILHQQVVEVRQGQSLDLGALDLHPARVPVHLAVRSAEVGGAWLRRVDPAVATGLFQDVARVEDGAVDFGAVEPGRYLVEGFARRGVGGVTRLIGDPVTDPVEIEVHANGTVSPGTVF